MLSYTVLIDDKDNEILFDQIYNSYRQGMYQIAYSILHDVQLAEDMTAETFVRVAANMKKISTMTEQKRRDYIAIIIRNISIDEYRKRRKNPEVFFDNENFVIDQNNPEDSAIGKVRYMDLVTTIDQLPDIYRDALKLRFLYQLTAEETGKLLGISANNVNQRVLRAKSKLEKLLREEHYFDEKR